uniref:Immunoglobulin subtype domain-containing protein n=1 Tax=Gasterosteus aculeatus aculeatus TaxID=481459 RepID=G3PZE8_GASAC
MINHIFFDADLPEGVLFVDWKINRKVTLVRFKPRGEPNVHHNSTGGFEFPEKIFSVTLKNLQEADSGVYTAVAVTRGSTEEKLLAEYKVTVQVSPVELIVDRVDSNSSESCDLHVTCRTHNSNISSTFRCVNRVCSEEGGERSEVTISGASLQVYLLNSNIICNHSNQVQWTQDFNTTEHLCSSNGKTERGNYFMIIMHPLPPLPQNAEQCVQHRTSFTASDKETLLAEKYTCDILPQGAFYHTGIVMICCFETTSKSHKHPNISNHTSQCASA